MKGVLKMQSALKMQSQKLVLFCLWAFLVGSALLAQDIQVNTYTTERQGGTDIAMAPDGHFVAWHRYPR